MFKAAIFDLDGLMIDSEPFWREALSIVLCAKGAAITPAECAVTHGLRVDETVFYFQKKFPLLDLELKKTSAEILECGTRLILERALAKPGLSNALEICRSLGLKLGLASSSPLNFIFSLLARLNLGGYFQVVCSGQNEKRGKPAPDVYLSVISQLEISSCQGVAFEDSAAGVISAKAAGLTCIQVPDLNAGEFEQGGADLVLSSLEQLSPVLLEKLYSAATSVPPREAQN